MMISWDAYGKETENKNNFNLVNFSFTCKSGDRHNGEHELEPVIGIGLPSNMEDIGKAAFLLLTLHTIFIERVPRNKKGRAIMGMGYL